MTKIVGELPVTSTRVSFPQGGTEDEGTILLIYTDEHCNIVICDQTPFHPVNHKWPDQPGDRGKITIGDVEIGIKDSVLWPIDRANNSPYYQPDQLLLNRKCETYIFQVAHLVSNVTIKGISNLPSIISDLDLVGKKAHLYVDKHYRNGLSRAHSASHLMSLALNKLTTYLWDEPVIKDSLGSYDLDTVAIQSSAISIDKSVDTYRLGKSLRKKGFETKKFIQDADFIRKEMEKTINCWISHHSDQPMLIESKCDTVESTRYWLTYLDGWEIRIPCGGTHVEKLKDKEKDL